MRLQIMPQVRTRLVGLNIYILDEVSMVACDDNYKISSHTCKGLNEFGMPLWWNQYDICRDFAQLPTCICSPLYSGSVGNSADVTYDCSRSASCHLNALWHQVTTVVILRENMRQKTQTPEDAKFTLLLLKHMRYAACTPEDIFLKTQIAGKSPEQPKLSGKEFRNVSIITEPWGTCLRKTQN